MVDAFHQAAVACDHPCAMIDEIVAKGRVQMPFGNGHTDSRRKPLPQRAGGRFDASKFEILRMPGTWAVQLPKIANVLNGRTCVAGEMQQAVDQHGAMARRQHETVAVGPFRRRWIELQIFPKQDRRNVCHAHRHSGMTAVCGLNRVHGQRPDGVGEHRFGNGHRLFCSSRSKLRQRNALTAVDAASRNLAPICRQKTQASTAATI